MQPVFCDKFQYFRPIPYFNVHKLKMDFDIADTSRSSGEYLESGSTSTSPIGAACILWPYFEYRYGSGRFFVTRSRPFANTAARCPFTAAAATACPARPQVFLNTFHALNLLCLGWQPSPTSRQGRGAPATSSPRPWTSSYQQFRLGIAAIWCAGRRRRWIAGAGCWRSSTPGVRPGMNVRSKYE